MIDTPGHADFGGEVERVLGMADGCLVLVDAAEGPMPQTRFVLSKALEARLKPVVVINKIDRPDARGEEVLGETFDLFVDLGADEETAEFPYLFASAKEGVASHSLDQPGDSMKPVFEAIVGHVPGPAIDAESPLRMRVTTLDWSDYVGRIAIGRIAAGEIRSGQPVVLMREDGANDEAKVAEVHVFDKLGRRQVDKAAAGDVVALVGLQNTAIGDTICDPSAPRALPRVTIDKPTLQMVFSINSSPFAGREGKYLTSRHLRERLFRETERNVALRVEDMDEVDGYRVSGRGLLHLSVLIETMRREGYEMSIGKPRVILRTRDGVREEPYESLVVEVPHEKMGPVMELVGARRGETVEVTTHDEYTFLVFSIPARGLIGLRTQLLNATQGTAIIHHRFECYKPAEGDMAGRANGVLVSMVGGRAVAFGLDGLQERAEMFVKPGDAVYEGMIVGENSRSDDMNVNPTKEKKLTNIRAAGSDRNIQLKPPRQFSLEAALEYIEDDELVEVTPTQLRLRKVVLSTTERRKQVRRLAKSGV
ncbi:MAG: GTP-binding protein [Pirellulaceae bacterium]